MARGNAKDNFFEEFGFLCNDENSESCDELVKRARQNIWMSKLLPFYQTRRNPQLLL
jgi:hypothetical protein